MSSPSLACSVRGCGLPLAFAARVLRCDAGHSYDIARSGYINLLQPQDRRSSSAGDSRDVVAARSRLLAGGIGTAILEAAAVTAAALPLDIRPQVVDLGSGTGYLLATLAHRRPMVGVGIDISVAAAEHSARAHPGLWWVVANADRRLPLPDSSTALLLSAHARRHPIEAARVLSPGGFLLVAVPARDDLAELRTALHGTAADRQRSPAVVAEHERDFTVVSRSEVRERVHVNASSMRDLVRVTYRGQRRQEVSRMESLPPMTVTLASEIVLLEKCR